MGGHACDRSCLLLSLEPSWSAVEALGAGIRLWWRYLTYQTWATRPSHSLRQHAFACLLSANSPLPFAPAPAPHCSNNFSTVRSHLQRAAPFPLQYLSLFLPSLLFPIQFFSAANPPKTSEHRTDVRNNRATDWCAWRPLCSLRSRTGGWPARRGVFPSCPADHSARFPLLVGRFLTPGQLTGMWAGLMHQLAHWKDHTNDTGPLAIAGTGQFLLGLCCLLHWWVLRACSAHQWWNEMAATVRCKTVSGGLFQSRMVDIGGSGFGW